MKKILYFDCLSGISGDMIIGALLDLGINKDDFLKELKKINIEGFSINIEKKKKKGIAGTDFDVILTDFLKDNKRNLFDIIKLIDDSKLDIKVKEMSKKIFKLIAEAESKIHNKPIEKIYFHEVGAIDSIIDIVGACICINMLEVNQILSSYIHVGTGLMDYRYGKLPIPAPATLEILKGVPIYSTGVKSELVTPTGAAIIKVIAEDFVSLPRISIEKIGYGLGKRDTELLGSLRVIYGNSVE